MEKRHGASFDKLRTGRAEDRGQKVEERLYLLEN